MPRIKLTLGYDGTAYHGWQKQPHHPTVQGHLENALYRLTQQPLCVYGAGRTDAGVHALGQVAHFDTSVSRTPAEWMRALNAMLPEDIVVNAVEEVDEAFHARFSACAKTYRYQILHAKQPAPLWRHTRWFVHYDLDVTRMRDTAKALVGLHCFTSFCAVDTDAPNHWIDLQRIHIEQNGTFIDITLNAPRFLRYMVRNIVGFLVEVGRGKRCPDEIPDLLAAKDRRAAGPTAPPQGLILVKIDY